MQNCMWQFLYIRPVIQLIGGIAAYADKEELYSAMVIIAAVSTFVMIPSIFTVARVLYDECEGLCVALKFIVIKISVGIILIEDAVQQFLYSSEAISISDDLGLSHFTEEEKFIRLYCLIALAECALLSIGLYYGFTKPLRPSVKCVLMPELDLPEIDPHNSKFDEDGNSLRMWTWNWYWSNIMAFRSRTCAKYLDYKSSSVNSTIEDKLLSPSTVVTPSGSKHDSTSYF